MEKAKVDLVPQKFNEIKNYTKLTKSNMAQNYIFNLEKIRELTSSIDVLQAEIHKLNEKTENFEAFKQSIIHGFTNEYFLSQIEEVIAVFMSLRDKIEKISKENISGFLVLQDNLIKKYKEKNQKKLRKLKLDQTQLGELGLSLIEKKKFNKIINEISYVPSIEVAQWLEILDALNQNSLFKRMMNEVKVFYESIIQDKLKLELSRIPEDIEITLIEEFKKAFYEDPYLTFREFLQDYEIKLTQKEFTSKKKIIAKVREKEELEKLKRKQKEQREAYNDYLKLSDKAFERKLRKKSREKLKDIKTSNKESKKIEINEEISKKIAKFKSKFNKSFEEKYLIQKDDEKDPLSLIRERKEKKQKEYKKYKEHFDES